MLGDRSHVLFIVANMQDAAMHLGMKRLHAPVEHLGKAGQIADVAHRQASLEELGQLADPALTKDAIAGRIRRLLALADRRAMELGVPTTEATLTADMLVP